MRYEDLQRIEIDGWKYVVFEEQCSVGILDGVVADGQKTLALPEIVEANGERLLVESVEMGAFYSVDSVEKLIVPDCYTYLDNDAFHDCRNLKKIIIGKGLESYRYWSFAGCPIEEIVISPDNPFIKVSEDGAMILSKNGDLLCSVIKDIPSIIVLPKIRRGLTFFIARFRHADLPERSLVLAKSCGARCPTRLLDSHAA